MSSHTSIYLYEDKNADIKVENVKDLNEKVISLSKDADVFLTIAQAEDLFDKLDIKLHNKTYLQLEELTYGLEVDLEEANGTIEYYRDKNENRVG